MAQSVATRLFATGLDLHFALMLIGEGPGAHRCTMALEELDGAIKQVRRLALAVEDRSPDGLQGRAGGPPFRTAWRDRHG